MVLNEDTVHVNSNRSTESMNFPCSVRNDRDTYIESVILTHNISVLYVWGSGLVLVYS